MIALPIISCALSAPGRCVDVGGFAPLPSPLACLIEGQRIAATWAREHPDRRVGGWRCVVVRPETAGRV